MSNNVLNVNFESEIEEAYLAYTEKVVLDRAMPDVRDGLKPVMRRIIYAMHQQGLKARSKHHKSARIVGDVIGKYHPHGDVSVYDAMVGATQEYNYRCTLVDGQGNFGSIDGDPAAAMRYTEARTTPYTDNMLEELDFNTVHQEANYDDTLYMPSVLPVKLPNLLINGSSSIGVGISNEIPPHNPIEVINATQALVSNPNLSIDDLLIHIKGPDYPTGGYVACDHWDKLYKTGQGSVTVRAVTHFDEDSNKNPIIVITEIPHKLSKSKLIQVIETKVNSGKIMGIKDIRDESDSKIRVVITLQKGYSPEAVLNKLYTETRLQDSRHYKFTALSPNLVAKTFNLKEMIEIFIQHRRNVTLSKLSHLLNADLKSFSNLEAILFATLDIDKTIEIITKSEDKSEAVEKLCSIKFSKARSVYKTVGIKDLNDFKVDGDIIVSHYNEDNDSFSLNHEQANYILGMSLMSLTKQSMNKMKESFTKVINNILYCMDYIYHDRDGVKLGKELYRQLEEQKTLFTKDKRRTKVVRSLNVKEIADVKSVDTVLILTKGHLIKNIERSAINTQNRGGQGRKASLKDNDEVHLCLKTNTTHTLLFFTNKGKCYSLPCSDVELCGLDRRGKPLMSLIKIDAKEEIKSILSVDPEEVKTKSVVMVTESGLAKAIAMKTITNVRSTGKKVIDFLDKDCLAAVTVADAKDSLVLFGDNNKAIRFPVAMIRKSAPGGRGVKAISFPDKGKAISVLAFSEGNSYATVATENGFGKVFDLNEIESKSRGGQGVFVNKGSKGSLVDSAIVGIENDTLILITTMGKLISIDTNTLSPLSRTATGPKLITLAADDKVKQIM